MLEKPNLSDDKIQTSLITFWDIQAQQLEFLPIGNDSNAWVYRVETDKEQYFLKVRKGVPHLAMLNAPHYLQSAGSQHVVAPIPTKSGKLYTPVEDYSLILYDWIHGTSAWDITLSDEQWQTWGVIMQEIHSIPINDTLSTLVPTEMFVSKWNKTVEQVNTLIQTQTFDDPICQQTAEYWKDQQTTIDKCYGRLLDIGQQLQGQSLQFVICHADIHQANIMIDEQEKIRIVDWDEVIIAPKERDLMFFVEDGHASQTVDAFLKGYGETEVNQLAITYYRYDWVVQEFGDYGERIFLTDDLSDTEKQFAFDEFKELFNAGDVIEQAFVSDAKLGK
jgi:spectinomycin phosphotransferase